MTKSPETLRGIIHGTTIELEHPLQMPDGSEVELVVKPKPMSDEQRRMKLESLFGSCRDDADELDEFLKWNREQRQQSRPEIDP